MNKFIKENILGCISIFIALIALSVSIKACSDSNKYNVIINKPELVIRAVKFDDSDSFLNILQDGRTLSIEINLQIKNNGNIAAENVMFPDIANLPEFKEAMISFERNRPFTIEQGETVYMSLIFTINYKTEEIAKDKILQINEPTWTGVTFFVGVKYGCELEPSVQYIKKVGFQISKKSVLLLLNE